MDMSGLVAGAANHVGMLDAYAFIRRGLTKSQVAILLYHRVCPERENQFLRALSVKDFEGQMEYLSGNFDVFSLDELAEQIVLGKPLPEKAVAITFDDGYKDNYSYAYPILKRKSIPATIFLATGHINSGVPFWWDQVQHSIEHASAQRLDLEGLGNYSLETESARQLAVPAIVERLTKLPDESKNSLIEQLLGICQAELPENLGRKLVLSWDEIREMSDGGIDFGAHTLNHPILTKVPLRKTEYEIAQSKRDIEERTSQKVTAFSYPNGEYNAEVVEVVKRCGFTCAVSILPGRLINSKSNVYQLSRIRARGDFNKFKAVLCGLWGDARISLFR